MGLLEKENINVNWANAKEGNVNLSSLSLSTPKAFFFDKPYLPASCIMLAQKTALHLAVEASDPTMVALLLGKGAEVHEHLFYQNSTLS